jgi:hypothetical protein
VHLRQIVTVSKVCPCCDYGVSRISSVLTQLNYKSNVRLLAFLVAQYDAFISSCCLESSVMECRTLDGVKKQNLCRPTHIQLRHNIPVACILAYRSYIMLTRYVSYREQIRVLLITTQTHCVFCVSCNSNIPTLSLFPIRNERGI